MNPGPPPGTEQHASASGLLHSLALYVEARGRLLQIESQEAGMRLSGLVGMLALALGGLFIGWMLAAPALVWLIAEHYHWPWTWVALGAAGIHLFLGLVFLLALKTRLGRLRLFEETFNQFRHDREWLSSNKHN